MNMTDHLNDHPVEIPFEYSQITDHIFIGSNACCLTEFDAMLTEHGITADISLEAERLDAAQGAEFFLWLPTIDHHAPTIDALRVGVCTLGELVDSGNSVYVHCRRGHGRAPTLVAAYFISKGSSVEEAIETIKTKRPQIHLEDEQTAQLHAFAKWCQAR